MKEYYSCETLFFKLVSELAICACRNPPSSSLSIPVLSETMSDISNESTIPQPSLNNPIITDSSKISPTTSESHSVQITTIRLNGDNFLRWSQSVWMYIRGRGKMGYLTGEKKAPEVDDPNYAIWDAENSMVMTWLVNSMEEDI